jgi:hypothetical protein
MTCVIATTISLLQASILSTGGQSVAFIGKGRDVSGSPLRGQRLRIIDLIIDGRREKFKVLGLCRIDDATVNILSTI